LNEKQVYNVFLAKIYNYYNYVNYSKLHINGYILHTKFTILYANPDNIVKEGRYLYLLDILAAVYL
jgi:hypothetical protein